MATKVKSKPAAVKKATAPKRGRKPNLYVTVVDGMETAGPFTTSQLVEWLNDFVDDTDDGVQVFKLDHEVSFKRVPSRIEIQNGSR
jgi:hypothetical protein